MAVEIRRGSSRFVDRGPGRATWHALSFGQHYDPDRTSFGAIVCHDEHLLSAGRGFPTHTHSGLVIVTWVLSGALTHTDSTGEAAVLPSSAIGVLRTGDGVEHSEIAAEPQTRFVQVWLSDPEATGVPSYDVVSGPVIEPLPGAVLSVAHLEAGESLDLPVAPLVHAFVARGALLRSSLAEPLATGDAFLFTDEPAHAVTAGVPTTLLVWSFA